MRGKTILAVGAVVLALVVGVCLLLIAGDTLQDEGAAIFIGVACGVVAGVPTSALTLIALAGRPWSRGGESYSIDND